MNVDFEKIVDTALEEYIQGFVSGNYSSTLVYDDLPSNLKDNVKDNKLLIGFFRTAMIASLNQYHSLLCAELSKHNIHLRSE